MGVLRFYLALCVIAVHSNVLFPWDMHDGVEAVEIFFLISGFYMAMILPKYSNLIEFYISRFIRIFIPYWLVCGMILIVSLIFGCFFHNWLELEPFIHVSLTKNGWAGVILVTFSNVTILFQDLSFFLVHDCPDLLHFTVDFKASEYPLYKYLIIPQAWSISLELMFYVFVPILVQLSNRKLFFIVLLSLILRIFFYEIFALNYDPWVHHFLPFEISLFILGILSFRFYSNWIIDFKKYLYINNNYYYSLYFSLIFLIFFILKITTKQLESIMTTNYIYLFSSLIWVVIIPIIFQLTASNKLDRYIGNLSYPIYLIHTIGIKISEIIIIYFGISELWLGKISALITILASVIMIHFFINPLEKQRYLWAKIISNKYLKSN